MSCTPEEMEKMRVDNFNSSEGSLHLEDDYHCDICHNKGLIMSAAESGNGYWYSTSKECKCMGVRRTIKRMQRSGLKNIIRDYTFQKFEATQAWQETIKDASIAYAKNPVGWYFIGGQSGAGKTHICTAICREFLLGGRVVKYMLWRDDIVRIKNAVTEGVEYSSMIDTFKKAPVLYIDDLFKTGKSLDGTKQRPTGADVNVAFEILNYRYNDPSLLTIISSECTINDILDIDEAVGGRIFERAKTAFSLKPDRSRNYRLKGVVEL
jgi:DNA replication protein DnaC